MSPSQAETTQNSVFTQMSPDEAREDLLMRLRAEIEYLDSQAPKLGWREGTPLSGTILEWVVTLCAIVSIFSISGLIAGYLMFEVIKRAQ